MNTAELLDRIEKIAQLGSYETDLTTGTWTSSDNFIHLFGLPKKDIYTVEEFQALVHPDDFDEVMAYFGKCLSEKCDFDYEYRVLKPDRTVVHVNSRSKIYYSDDGTPLRIVGIKQDITRRKQFEEQLKELNKITQLKSDILGHVAHDLKNPLYQIEGFLNLIRQKPKSLNDALVGIDESLTMAKKIIQDLLEIAQLEDANFKIEMRKVDLNLLIKEAIRRFSLQIKKKGLSIHENFQEGVIASINALKFHRLVDNLLSNAIKFSHPGGTITLETSRQNNLVELRIKDSGIGIPKNQHKKVFDKFSEARRTGTLGEKTTGLGLSIVRQIVALHRGKINVESKENKGTTMIITLPL